MNDVVYAQQYYPPGTEIDINGTRFCILDYGVEYPGLIKVISADRIWPDVSYGYNSNWRDSSLRDCLNHGLMFDRIKSVFGKSRMYFFSRDLVSIDGYENGCCFDLVSILTLSEYAQYRHILRRQQNVGPWWLLTPRSTKFGGDGNSVFFVQDNGIVDFQDSNCKCGVRPVVTTDISILAKSEEVKDGG